MPSRKYQIVVPRPDRVRRLDGPFGWIDAALWRRRWLQRLTSEEVAVYTFLCLVADRQGVSFYRRDRIADQLGEDLGVVTRALGRLRDLDLVAFRAFGPHAPEGFHQVLSLPDSGPLASPAGVAALWRPKSL